MSSIRGIARGGVPGRPAMRRGPLQAMALAMLAFALGACARQPGPPPGIEATHPAWPVASFPLRVPAGQRHLSDSRGQPFLLHADTAWSLVVQLRREDVERYLEVRRRQGFNAILVNLIEHRFADHAPANAYGEAPFTTAGDFSTPNAAYFDHAAYVVSQARERGMLVLLAPAYMGYDGGNEGWYQAMRASGATKLREYGRFVARRFSAFDNILWVEGGDFDPPERELLQAVAEGITDVDPAALQTFHGRRGTSALSFLGASTRWLNVNDIYTDEKSVTAAARAEYSRATLPFFLIECRYEQDPARSVGEADVRRYAYETLLAGGAGHVYGNHFIWQFIDGWRGAMDAPGATSFAHLRSLLESFQWWTIVPDTTDRLLVAGTGSGARAYAAFAEDRRLAIAYLPTARAVTVDLGQLRGPKVEARWYDPAHGRFSEVASSPFDAQGYRVLEPEVGGRAGTDDWLLVLRSTP